MTLGIREHRQPVDVLPIVGNHGRQHDAQVAHVPLDRAALEQCGRVLDPADDPAVRLGENQRQVEFCNRRGTAHRFDLQPGSVDISSGSLFCHANTIWKSGACARLRGG